MCDAGLKACGVKPADIYTNVYLYKETHMSMSILPMGTCAHMFTYVILYGYAHICLHLHINAHASITCVVMSPLTEGLTESSTILHELL